MFKKRESGILLHISSLPGKYGIGDLGKTAYSFVDQLESMGQLYWQILPTNEPNDSNSPYDNSSSFAQNPMLISLDLLYEDKLLEKSDFDNVPLSGQSKIEFDKLKKWKKPILLKAAKAFHIKHQEKKNSNFEKFCKENEFWLEHYTAYKVLKNRFNQLPWFEWDNESKIYNKIIIARNLKNDFIEIQIIKIIQYFFYKQWKSLKNYANAKNISLIGDLPIYISHDSADVWANQNLFKLEKNGDMIVKSGCPPDYFMEEGQVWGHPIYNWESHKKEKYKWWISRVGFLSTIVDIIRFDHFNGLLKYWEIPLNHNNGVNGSWSNGPGKLFIDALYDHVPGLKMIAEDLGELSDEVVELRSFKNIPGMKVFQFEFDKICKDIKENKVLFTGTHDNDTLIGWFDKELKKLFHDGNVSIKSNELRRIIDRNSEEIHLEIIKYCMETEYPLVIIPLQDLIGLHSDCRMNEPGTLNKTNWSWKYNSEDLTNNLIKAMNSMTSNSGRT
tara:strand:- start:65 stop:1567 length:1503 start_codon:yes stop_codon:yes gene_type:complete